ncbi:hypothetical protein QT397_10180 [Microbulbifer sp. MKSA007]|uniref:hypothetical protein n=1 Tax=Microbulbifer sp. EKSA005 TaxID=3243364 RepID=UPI002B2F43E2|nr:hypothetical protein QT397_10180 [Microbulbifer sp. MKSA007]
MCVTRWRSNINTKSAPRWLRLRWALCEKPMILSNEKRVEVFEIIEVSTDNFYIYGPYRVLNSEAFNEVVSLVNEGVDQVLISGEFEFDLINPPEGGVIEIRSKP